MSRKVILYIAQSLDGFIADSAGSVDWISGDDRHYEGDYGYSEFINGIDTVIIGYKTYRQIVDELSPGKWMYDDLKSYVLTNPDCEDTENIKFVKTQLPVLMNALKHQDGKDIWICGGADVLNQCVRENLIDRYIITTVPVILGAGIRLFAKNGVAARLKWKDVKTENELSHESEAAFFHIIRFFFYLQSRRQ